MDDEKAKVEQNAGGSMLPKLHEQQKSVSLPAAQGKSRIIMKRNRTISAMRTKHMTTAPQFKLHMKQKFLPLNSYWTIDRKAMLVCSLKASLSICVFMRKIGPSDLPPTKNDFEFYV